MTSELYIFPIFLVEDWLGVGPIFVYKNDKLLLPSKGRVGKTN